jgi:predicted alpha/beta superfamily hydrolase
MVTLHNSRLSTIVAGQLVKCIPILVIVAVLLTACSEKWISPKQEAMIWEADYGTRYTIDVQLPPSYDSAKADGYPILLYVDAEWMNKPIRKAMAATGLTNQILVGIGYAHQNRRMEDFSPALGTDTKAESAERFVNFIKKDVLPRLSQQYRFSSQRADYTFCGHSMGGTLGTYLLLRHPELFSKYVLISSALMHKEQIIFRVEAESRPVAKLLPARVFLATGTLEERGMHTTRQHLIKLLGQHYTPILIKANTYQNQDHNGVIDPALKDGLRAVNNL